MVIRCVLCRYKIGPAIVRWFRVNGDLLYNLCSLALADDAELIIHSNDVDGFHSVSVDALVEKGYAVELG